MTAAFPHHEECYTWPQVAVVTHDMTAAVLNVR